MDRLNLLVIDDDPNIRNLLSELLGGRPDLHLLIAGSGPEAVQHFASKRIDLVLTDIHMPGFTGLELMADMKKINFKPEIVVMTANATPENVETARELGARSVILKPFDDLEVIEAEINKAANADVTTAKVSREANANLNLFKMRPKWPKWLFHHKYFCPNVRTNPHHRIGSQDWACARERRSGSQCCSRWWSLEAGSWG